MSSICSFQSSFYLVRHHFICPFLTPIMRRGYPNGASLGLLFPVVPSFELLEEVLFQVQLFSAPLCFRYVSGAVRCQVAKLAAGS